MTYLRPTLAAIAIACLSSGAVRGAERCFTFPVGVGPEEVCASGTFQTGPIFAPPGLVTVKTFPFEFANRTERDMHFTVEATGDALEPDVQLLAAFTLAPGGTRSVSVNLVIQPDAGIAQRTKTTVQVGWGASGQAAGEDDYLLSVEEPLEMFVFGPDSDGDGLTDEEETVGYDADGDGVIDVDLPAMGADPRHKDIFLELDWEDGAQIHKSAIDAAKAAYAQAPVDAGGVPNPDGRPGINLWVDTGGFRDANGVLVGDDLGGGNAVGEADLGFGAAYYPTKAANFDPARRVLFHYALMDKDISGAQGELGGNDIRLGASGSSYQAYTIFHELGHNLYLSHGGNPDESGIRNCEPNYISSMNYRYSYIRGLGVAGLLDFSPARLTTGTRVRAPLGDVNENAVDETSPLDDSDTEHFASYAGPPVICVAVCQGGPRDDRRCATDDDCADDDNPANNGVCAGALDTGRACTGHVQCGGGRCSGRDRTAPAGTPIDFDGDGTLEPTVSQSLDGTYYDGVCGNEGFAGERTTLTGWNDWGNIRFQFFQFGAFLDGAPATIEPELTEQELMAYLEETSTTDLEVRKTGPVGPVEAGETVSIAYAISIANKGPHPASVVAIRDVLPEGFALTSASPACALETGGDLLCGLGGLVVNAVKSVAVSVSGIAACRGGAPQPIRNTAIAVNQSPFAGAPPVPEHAVSTLDTAVVDTRAPSISVSLTPSEVWPPNHSFFDVAAAVAVSDACDDAPLVRLVSIVSNEPGDGVGDGSTSPDIEGAAFGTDDRTFRLRAERAGRGHGRVYTVTYEAVDASGNAAQGTAIVTVPKSRR
jgi:uncharacterized repeat protein (TIGR01451 family)